MGDAGDHPDRDPGPPLVVARAPAAVLGRAWPGRQWSIRGSRPGGARSGGRWPSGHREGARRRWSRPPAGDADRRRPPATGLRGDRGPRAARRIPASDWLAALQHGAREVFGDEWELQLARFLAFLRRRVTGDYEVDEYGFDREVTERFLMASLRPIADKWFRVEVRGAENIPADGGALVVSNHSGTIPVDGLMTMVSIHDTTGRFLRPLGADLVFRLPVVGAVARKSGATLACNEDAGADARRRARRCLARGLQGHRQALLPALQAPAVRSRRVRVGGRAGRGPDRPLSVVGAEEIYPSSATCPRWRGCSGCPHPDHPFFPLLGPLGLVPLPSKWLLEFGEPIRTDEFDEGAADDPMLVFNVTDQVRETVQQTLYTLLMQRRSVFR